MKKSVLYLCAGILALGLTACGGKPEEESTSQGTEQTGSSDNSSEGTESTGGSEDMESSGESSTGSDGQQDGEDAGDGSESGWSEEMTGLRAAVVEAVGEENYWPDMPMDGETFQVFFGLTDDLYDDYMAESPMISTNVDTLVIVKAKEGQTDAVYDLLNTYRDNKVNDTMQYPMNIGKIQASMLEKVGDYVIFVQLGGMTPDEEEAALAQCQEANQKAMEALKLKLGQE